MKLSDYILKPLEERQAHIDLSTPCTFGNWRHSSSSHFAYHEVERDTVRKHHRCHLCKNDSGSEQVCINPLHSYIGTAYENSWDRPEQKRRFKKDEAWTKKMKLRLQIPVVAVNDALDTIFYFDSGLQASEALRVSRGAISISCKTGKAVKGFIFYKQKM